MKNTIVKQADDTTVQEILRLKQVRVDCGFKLSTLHAEDVAAFLEDEIGNDSQETLVVLCSDSVGHVVSYSRVFTGTLNHSLATPRDIMQRCLLSNASSFILAHNHPSRLLNPSQNDLKSYDKMQEIGNMMGIPMTDGFIVSNNEYLSFLEEGLMLKF